MAGAEHATGTVIDLYEDLSSNDGTVYYPVVRFTTCGGSNRRVPLLDRLLLAA
jgi:hypothetical protein